MPMTHSPPKPDEGLEARQAEIDAGVARYIAQMPLPDTLEQAIAERDAWIESACMFSRNEDYYRGLVDQIGALFGKEAYTADDGSISQDILRDKVPDLAAAELKALRERVGELEAGLGELLAFDLLAKWTVDRKGDFPATVRKAKALLSTTRERERKI